MQRARGGHPWIKVEYSALLWRRYAAGQVRCWPALSASLAVVRSRVVRCR